MTKFEKVDNKAYDFINPDHYKKGGKEVIEMMEDIWGVEKLIAHCEMCAFKYRMRLGEKPGQPINRDLEKANWYENKANELREKQEKDLFKFSIKDKNDYSSITLGKAVATDSYKVESEQEIKVGDKYCCVDEESERYGDIFEVGGATHYGVDLFDKNYDFFVTFKELKENYKKVEQ